MADLQQKYQKLAQEYVKLRDQKQVLKKGVLDEQTRVNDQKEVIKEKDQKIRKLEQEVDSLTFRNQQLTKRVNVLQNELDLLETKGKKSKHRDDDHHHSAPPSTGIMHEELLSKIEENVRLHKQVYEEGEAHRQSVTDLQNKLSNIERDNSQHQSVLEAMKKQQQETVERIQEDKARLEVRVQTQEKMVQESTLKADRCQEQLTRVKEELGEKLGWATRIIENKLPFNDTEFQHLNALNVPTHDRKHQKKSKELIGQAFSLIRELCAGLSNYHTYTEQRCKIFPIDASTGAPLSAVNEKLCAHLHENASYLRPIEQAFRTFNENIKEDTLTTLETAVDLKEFASRFSTYVKYHEKLLPYQLLSLEEECALSTCPETLESRNMDLHATLKKLSAALAGFESYITLLASASDKSNSLPVANHQAIFERFAESAINLYEIIRDVSKNYNFKVSLEHQLPTATQKLKTTDECVVSSLISLVTTAGKVANFLKTNQEFFATPMEFRTRGHSMIASCDGMGSSPDVAYFRQRAAKYISSLNRPCPDSVPFDTAIRDHKILISSTESKEGMAHQLEGNREKVVKLEQEKEHWLLESQLIQIKLDKEMKKTMDLQAELARLNGEQPAQRSGGGYDTLQLQYQKAAPTEESMGERPLELGNLDNLSMDFGDTDAILRENMIREHYTSHLQQTVSQLQVSEGKVVTFEAECRAMRKRLMLSEKEKEKIVHEQKSAQQTISQLKDDLQTTTKSYESQLSMMSEHLASLNEKLTVQRDEIDALKLTVKSSRRGR